MGPFALLAYTFGSLVPIMGSIAATMAIAGQPWGYLPLIAVAVAYDIFRWKHQCLTKKGLTLSTTCKVLLTALIDAASVLGVFMRVLLYDNDQS